jgi:Na+/H+ antiporter NhaD/arsenite permease-like protein
LYAITNPRLLAYLLAMIGFYALHRLPAMPLQIHACLLAYLLAIIGFYTLRHLLLLRLDVD